jgi:hypothetical protein
MPRFSTAEAFSRRPSRELRSRSLHHVALPPVASPWPSAPPSFYSVRGFGPASPQRPVAPSCPAARAGVVAAGLGCPRGQPQSPACGSPARAARKKDDLPRRRRGDHESCYRKHVDNSAANWRRGEETCADTEGRSALAVESKGFLHRADTPRAAAEEAHAKLTLAAAAALESLCPLLAVALSKTVASVEAINGIPIAARSGLQVTLPRFPWDAVGATATPAELARHLAVLQSGADFVALMTSAVPSGHDWTPNKEKPWPKSFNFREERR